MFNTGKFDLTEHIASHPIMDEPFKRHLRTDPIFRELRERREAHEKSSAALLDAMDGFEATDTALKATEAKIELMQSMEDL